jgi:hypothetical protein
VTKRNFNRPQFQRQAVWAKHDQYLSYTKRHGVLAALDGDNPVVDSQTTKKYSRLDQRLRDYDGDDPFVMAVIERSTLGKPIDVGTQNKVAGVLGAQEQRSNLRTQNAIERRLIAYSGNVEELEAYAERCRRGENLTARECGRAGHLLPNDPPTNVPQRNANSIGHPRSSRRTAGWKEAAA